MASPSTQVKRLFNSACKADSSVRDMGLREWARSMMKELPVVKEWWENKHGKTQREAQALREKNKGATLRAIALATKNAKQKKK